MGYRHDPEQNNDDHDFSENNLPPRGGPDDEEGGDEPHPERRYRNDRFKRERFEPKPKFDETKIDMESNFRKFYF
jgi:hypothetical protein